MASNFYQTNFTVDWKPRQRNFLILKKGGEETKTRLQRHTSRHCDAHHIKRAHVIGYSSRSVNPSSESPLSSITLMNAVHFSVVRFSSHHSSLLVCCVRARRSVAGSWRPLRILIGAQLNSVRLTADMWFTDVTEARARACAHTCVCTCAHTGKCMREWDQALVSKNVKKKERKKKNYLRTRLTDRQSLAVVCKNSPRHVHAHTHTPLGSPFWHPQSVTAKTQRSSSLSRRRGCSQQSELITRGNDRLPEMTFSFPLWRVSQLEKRSRFVGREFWPGGRMRNGA